MVAEALLARDMTVFEWCYHQGWMSQNQAVLWVGGAAVVGFLVGKHGLALILSAFGVVPFASHASPTFQRELAQECPDIGYWSQTPVAVVAVIVLAIGLYMGVQSARSQPP